MDRFPLERPALRSQLSSIFPPSLWGNRPTIISAVIWLLPLLMWGTLWLSISSGDIEKFFKPDSFSNFLKEGIRAAFPIIAVSWAIGYITIKLYLRRPRATSYISPIGILTVYGLVGFASATLSLDVSYSMYWAGAYISVPLVLLALIWDGNHLNRLNLLLNATWFILLLAATILFIIAVTKLDLGRSIANPIDLLQCEPIGHWFTFTGQVLRSTGVGRYAAIAAIIAFSFIWRIGGWKTTGLKGYSRIPWSIIFVGALALLMSTGARTSIVAFMVAISVIFLLYGGKKGLFLFAVAAVFALVLGWSTGFHNGFINACMFNDFSKPISAESHSVAAMASAPPTSQAKSQVNPTPPINGPGDLTTSAKSQVNPTLPINDPENLTTSSATPKVESTPPIKDRWNVPGLIRVPRTFFNFSGRVGIWEDSLDLVGDSPVLGHGFQSDRLLLGTQVHNAFLQSLIQTGILGATFFMAGLTLGFVLMFRAIRNLKRLPTEARHTVILTAGLLVFLGIRSIAESTGAFFGIDWLILAPILLYAEVISGSITSLELDATKPGD